MKKFFEDLKRKIHKGIETLEIEDERTGITYQLEKSKNEWVFVRTIEEKDKKNGKFIRVRNEFKKK